MPLSGAVLPACARNAAAGLGDADKLAEGQRHGGTAGQGAGYGGGSRRLQYCTAIGKLQSMDGSSNVAQAGGAAGRLVDPCACRKTYKSGLFGTPNDPALLRLFRLDHAGRHDAVWPNPQLTGRWLLTLTGNRRVTPRTQHTRRAWARSQMPYASGHSINATPEPPYVGKHRSAGKATWPSIAKRPECVCGLAQFPCRFDWIEE